MKAAFMGLMLAGCAIAFPEFVYDWEKTHDPLPFTWHQIPQEAVNAMCGVSSFHVIACNLRDHEHCWIFTAYSKVSEQVRLHEEKHCAGYSHQIL